MLFIVQSLYKKGSPFYPHSQVYCIHSGRQRATGHRVTLSRRVSPWLPSFPLVLSLWAAGWGYEEDRGRICALPCCSQGRGHGDAASWSCKHVVAPSSGLLYRYCWFSLVLIFSQVRLIWNWNDEMNPFYPWLWEILKQATLVGEKENLLDEICWLLEATVPKELPHFTSRVSLLLIFPVFLASQGVLCSHYLQWDFWGGWGKEYHKGKVFLCCSILRVSGITMRSLDLLTLWFVHNHFYFVLGVCPAERQQSCSAVQGSVQGSRLTWPADWALPPLVFLSGKHIPFCPTMTDTLLQSFLGQY
jgi:hypothetical protein